MNITSAALFAFAPDLLWFTGDLTIKATVVLVAAAVFTWTAQRSGAALRHRLWCSAYLALLILPGLLFALPKWPIIPTWSFRTSVAQAPGFVARANEGSTISRRPEKPAELGPSAAQAIDEGSADRLPGSPHFVSDLKRGPLVRKESLAEKSHGTVVPARDVESSASTESGLKSGLFCGVLTLLWLLGVGAYSFRIYAGCRASARLARSAVPVRDRQWLELLEQVQSSLRVPARVELCESDGAMTPMVSGILRPRILLPREANRWPLALRRHVLIHELAHVKRRDLLLQLIGRLTTALYWFHPLAWYGLRRMQLEREIACDDYVLTVVERPSDYAAQLVEFARRMRGIVHSWAACMANESTLEVRVRSLLDRARSHRPLSAWAAQSLLAIAIGGATLLAIAQPGVQADVNDRAAKQPDRVPATSASQVKDAIAVGVAAATPSVSSSVAAADHGDDPTKSSSDSLVSVTGRVILPDGSPAANVFVSAIENDLEFGTTVTTARTDVAGRFHLNPTSDIDCAIHAYTSDWRLQAAFQPSREALDHPVEMKLSPARKKSVLVKSGGKPVAGARVVATSANRGAFLVKATSGPDGAATLWLPATDRLQIDAWHQQLGVAQARFVGKNGNDRPTEVIELALLPPKPHTIRVVDPAQRPVGNLRISLQGRASRDKWFLTKSIDEAAVQTNSRGEVTIPWLPADMEHVNIVPLARSWKVDDVGMSTKADHGLTTIQIRRLRPVTGRLIMPPGAKPEGILVYCVGSGSRNRFHHMLARARQDGTFTLLVASDHGYLLGVDDAKWVSDYWTGVILTNDSADPAPIILHAYPTIPLTVRATRGPKGEPWAGLYINAQRNQDFRWLDSHGQLQPGSGGVLSGRTTDANGTAHFGVGRGAYRLVFSSGDWWEERTVNVTSDQPVSITFNRPWLDKREVVGRMTQRNKPRPPTPTTTLRAFSIGRWLIPAATKTFPDGRFTATGETAHVYVFAADPKEGVNAFRYFGPGVSTSDDSLDFVPSGIYGGEVVNEKGNPIVGCRVRLVPQEPDGHYTQAFDFILDETKVDNRGRFKFDRAPTGVPMRALIMGLPGETDPKAWYVGEFKMQLSPGEVRDGEVIEVESGKSRAAATRIAPKKAAADRLTGLIRDARLSQMRVLIVANGDSNAPARNVLGALLDEQEHKEMLRYLPLQLAAEDLPAAADLFTGLKLQPPKAGEILLAVLDGEGRQVGALLLPVRDPSSTVKQGVEFLKNHAPARRDAHKLLSVAQEQARATGRRVWIIEGETRCGPCFRLSRWLDDQHALLEKDYVFVKLLVGCDNNAEDVVESVKRRKGGGIPWFAISDPDGNVLATSDGPSGNIGFPDDRLGKRHLRGMLERTAQRLTSADMDRLIESLGD